MVGTSVEVAQRCISNIRLLSAETVQAAKSGHPGAPMGCAPMAHLLWSEIMNYCPEEPKWANRDRFVLSNGHACALQYTMLHLTGYGVSIDDLKDFRQVGSITPGHPEVGVTNGVEVSTGPLGQGISNAVGLAIAETHLAATYNRPGFPVVDNFTYVICGDGCLQEGVASEACSLAGTLGLGKLIVLYDDNHIQIDGSTELAFTEDVAMRYEAYGWHVQVVEDGDSADVSAMRTAVKAAQEVTDRPSIIKINTTIGFGAVKQGTAGVHGAPIGDEDIAKLKEEWGFDPAAKFFVDSEVADVFGNCRVEGKKSFDAWNVMFAKYKANFLVEATEFERVQAGKLPEGWELSLPTFTAADSAKSTRQLSQGVLRKIVPVIPELMGGSADLTGSNLTKVDGNSLDYSKVDRSGRYLRFGVREHGMCAIANGMAAYGGLVPFTSTFVVFAGYALGAMRVCALSHLRVLFVFTHDSIGLGEDGPTHQPIETLTSLRSIPNFLVLRPADGNEVSGAYKLALENEHGPSFIAFSRQGVPQLAGTSVANVARGAYVLQDQPDYKVVIVGTGTEVALCVDAAAALQAAGCPARVVSMPCWSLFDAQNAAYRESVFPTGTPVLSVEALGSLGWEKYAHAHIAMKTFGASGKGGKLMEHFGFTVDNVADKATKLVAFYSDGPAPTLSRPEL